MMMEVVAVFYIAAVAFVYGVAAGMILSEWPKKNSQSAPGG
jgi:hypothetical protein